MTLEPNREDIERHIELLNRGETQTWLRMPKFVA